MSYHWRSGAANAAYSPTDAQKVAKEQPRVINLRKIAIDGEMKSITVRLVETHDVIDQACGLINERYIKKGYGASHRIPNSAYHATFTAELDGTVVGTITLGVEADNGLAADNTFRHEIDELRSTGQVRLCELTKFAFADGFHSRQVMASLFHIVFVYGSRNFGCTDLLIEVHQKHARFYELMLGFERYGAPKVNASVNASLHLMRISVAKIRAQITAASEGADISSRSLYNLFFPIADEDGIYNRLMLTDKKLAGQQVRDHVRLVLTSGLAERSIYDDPSKSILTSTELEALLDAARHQRDDLTPADQLKLALFENAQLRRLLSKYLAQESSGSGLPPISLPAGRRTSTRISRTASSAGKSIARKPRNGRDVENSQI